MHPSDIILLPPYAGGLLFWPVFWIVGKNREALFWRLAKIFACTAVGLIALAAAQLLTGLFGPMQLRLINLFPIINMVSLMGSTVACFQVSTGQVQSFLQRNFIAVVGIPFFSVMVMFLVGGCKNIDIALHEARTTATVLPPTEGHSRKSIRYCYEVDGHKYIGGATREILLIPQAALLKSGIAHFTRPFPLLGVPSNSWASFVWAPSLRGAPPSYPAARNAGIERTRRAANGHTSEDKRHAEQEAQTSFNGFSTMPLR